MTRHPDLLAREDSILLLVDVQERLLPIIHDRAAGRGRDRPARPRAPRILGVPVLVSEQYPKGLGPTVPAIRAAAAGRAGDREDHVLVRGGRRAPRRRSGASTGVRSCSPASRRTSASSRRRSTSWRAGIGVHVVSDATGTRLPREPRDRPRARGPGRRGDHVGRGRPFEWMGRSDIPEFKEVQALLKDLTEHPMTARRSRTGFPCRSATWTTPGSCTTRGFSTSATRSWRLSSTPSGFNYARLLVERKIGFPTVHTEADYRIPMPYGIVLEFDLTIRSLGTTSVAFRYLVRGAGEEAIRAEARTTVVCIDMDRFEKKPLPPDIRKILAEYLEI